MSKLLIISDIHNRITTAQRLIDTVPHDKCILLGDYFDNFGDSHIDAMNTALWLKGMVLDNPKIIPLIGNHDQMYLFPCRPDFRCSGFTHEKQRAISSVIDKKDVEKLKFYHIEDGWVFSHAGLRVSIWKDILLKYNDYDKSNETVLSYFSKIIKSEIDFTIKNLYEIKPVPLLECGWDRGGDQPFGGITWCDFRNFASISEINQFVGHTPNKIPRVHIQNKQGGYTQKSIIDYLAKKESFDKNSVSINYNLDTHSNHYAVITDGVVEIFDAILGESFTNLKKFAIPENELNGLHGLNCLGENQNEK